MKNQKEKAKPIHKQIIEHCGGEEKFKEIAGLKPKQETLEEVGKFAERKYLERLENFQKVDFKDGVIEGAKWQAKKDRLDLGLLEIELNHTKKLLASCEQALEERDRQSKKMYYLLDALQEIEKIVDSQNPTHERIWRVAYEAIEQFKKKQP
jgi:hypothetical protein